MAIIGTVQLVQGGEEMMEHVFAWLTGEGIQTEGNADFFSRTYAHFGIDEARELRDRAYTRALTEERRVFIVVTPAMTSDAQNALLKTLEESPGNALFVFVVPSPGQLLPTLRSRAQIIPLKAPQSSSSVSVEKFISSSPETRLDMLKPLLEKGSDDRRDMSGIMEFLSELETRLSETPEHVRPIYTARKYISDKGALVKPLLEQIALLIPVVR